MTRLPLPCPPPGAHPGTAPDTYFAWTAASNTALGRLRKSAAHCKAYLDGQDLDTDAAARRPTRGPNAAMGAP